MPLTEGSPEEAALRGVERLIRIPGPNGLWQEIFTQANLTDAPLQMTNAAGFVTGELGLGHVAIITKSPIRCAATTLPCSTRAFRITSTRP